MRTINQKNSPIQHISHSRYDSTAFFRIKGFTLIEMIIVMLITGVIMASVALMLSAGFTNYFTGVRVTTLTNQATIAMARMTKELQQASSFSAINATNMTFTTTNGSSISYSWSSPILTRTGASAQ